MLPLALWGAVHAGPLETYLAASRDFERLMSDGSVKGTAPRLSDPMAASALSVLADPTVLSATRYGVSDLGRLTEICGKANAAHTAYILFGLKDEVATATPATIVRLADRNLWDYQDEVFPLMTFSVKCMAVLIPLMTTFYEGLASSERTTVRQQGIRHVREGIFKLYSGALTIATQGQLSARHRTALLASLADNAAIFAVALPADRREAIARLAGAAAPNVSKELKAHVQRIAAAMKESSCNALCRA